MKRFLSRVLILISGIAVGGSMLLSWPLNFFAFVGAVGLGYVVGRWHQQDIDNRDGLRAIYVEPPQAFTATRRQRRQWEQERADLNPALRRGGRIPRIVA